VRFSVVDLPFFEVRSQTVGLGVPTTVGKFRGTNNLLLYID
jgi:hypothetical protein